MLTPKEKRSSQYQMRLIEEFRQQLEEAIKDGDTSLATWIKRVLSKKLQSRGITPKA
ncbi:hypothetical protein [Gilliamella sp. wkB171]|uniref:hypothetical protein n=1 Tax=Gilliamella sp. wkB171 TaxID=3120258 RepID=UPI0015CF44F6|nr:hypothetical protein [Gilliamella apicola]